MKKKRPGLMPLLKGTMKELGQNDPLTLAGATAFFTTFALPAILMIILQLARLAFSAKQGTDELADKLVKYVGQQTADLLLSVLKGYERIAANWLAIVAGFIFLLFVATTLFKVIKNSLNQIWDIKVTGKKSVGIVLRMRLRELVVIISAGILFILSIGLEAVRTIATDEFAQLSTLTNLILNNTFSFIFSVLVVTAWFGLIFCFLPDGRVPVRIGFIGAFFTGILFTGGKLLLKAVLLYSNLNNIFGKSAAVVLLMLFVFYSALIFYFGAAFTKTYTLQSGLTIKPLPYAVNYEMKENTSEER